MGSVKRVLSQLLPSKRARTQSDQAVLSDQAIPPLVSQTNDTHRLSEQTLELSILHLSDTHGHHWELEERFKMPPAEILIHTGDMTDGGSMDELKDFNTWLGTIKHRFKHILVIAGNHDLWKGQDVKRILSHATYLDHECASAVESEYGLKVFGSTWIKGARAYDPDLQGHKFDLMPEGVDILMSHSPPAGVFDTCGYSLNSLTGKYEHHTFGSSSGATEAIRNKKPRCHFFGHMHEQRGYWLKQGSDFAGGCEYEQTPGKKFPTQEPPPDWPCELTSCNPMLNRSHELVAPVRLIAARRADVGSPWRFSVA